MYTFDVFDTLITRKTATPEGIFALMQQKMKRCEEYSGISDYIKNNFYYLRINAEKLARRSYGTIMGVEDVTLEQIYEAMTMTGSLSHKEIQQLIELEKLTEYENVVGISRNIQRVKALITKGKRVVLISDMYLDKNAIKTMLVKADPVFNDIPLYVSSEEKKGKWTGSLYETVKNREGMEYQYWIHCGNDPNSDVKYAKKHGIKAELFHFESFMSCEKKVLEKNGDDYITQLTIGVARNTRLKNSLAGPAAIGCSVGGIILFPYVWWLLQESIKKGIKRLYFIARDGFVLKRMADKIIENYDYEIETHYIYGSRKAWRIPSFSESNDDLYKFIRWSYAQKIKDIRTLADVFEIPVEEFMHYLPTSFQNAEKKLTLIHIVELVKKLNRNQKFKKYFREFHKENRKIVADYLKQEINISDDAFAFVDLAGGGYTQGCMADIIGDFYDKKVRTFFFKLDQMNAMNNCIYYNFIPSYLYLNLIIEVLCRAPHGQTIGYRKENDRIAPVLKEDEGNTLIRHGFNEYLMGIEKFTEEYSLMLKANDSRGDHLELMFQYMEYITRTPDKEIAEFLGGMPNSVSGREKDVVEFAPVLSQKAIWSIFLWRTNEPIDDYYNGSSLEYSILRCSLADRKKINFCQKHYHLYLGKLVHLLKKAIKPESRYNLASNFPCEFLSDKIVLYAAGKLGQDLYRKINHSENSRVVQWVDQDYRKYKKMGFNVTNPNDIGNVEYDNVVIAVLDESVSESIRKTLIARGVPNEKIVWINLRLRWS